MCRVCRVWVADQACVMTQTKPTLPKLMLWGTSNRRAVGSSTVEAATCLQLMMFMAGGLKPPPNSSCHIQHWKPQQNPRGSLILWPLAVHAAPIPVLRKVARAAYRRPLRVASGLGRLFDDQFRPLDTNLSKRRIIFEIRDIFGNTNLEAIEINIWKDILGKYKIKIELRKI